MNERGREVPEHCYVVLQRFPDSGWGLAAMATSLDFIPVPLVYCGTKSETIVMMTEAATELAAKSGLPTRLVRFVKREDILVFGEDDRPPFGSDPSGFTRV